MQRMSRKGKEIESSLDLHQQVLNSTLEAVSDDAANPCVICLESVSDKATAIPCKHDNFDFICLASWVEEKNSCPLCKALITAIHYGDGGDRPKVYKVRDASRSTASPAVNHCTRNSPSAWVEQFREGHRYPSRQFMPRRQHRRPSPPPSDAAILLRRKRIYELDLYSLHVGSNRLSGYSDLTPARFNNDPHLLSRARKWIRRELQVFDAFAVTSSGPSRDSATATSVLHAKRASNAEFLLEYIIAILKTVDIKGSKGQAQEMLSEFLGQRSSLFLHELNAWLRSPFEELAVWDRNVRYEWPVGEEQALRKRVREETSMSQRQDDWSKRRRIERWIPD